MLVSPQSAPAAQPTYIARRPCSPTRIVQTGDIALTTCKDRGTSIRLLAGLRICRSSVK
jgi:hypothetical protein